MSTADKSSLDTFDSVGILLSREQQNYSDVMDHAIRVTNNAEILAKYIGMDDGEISHVKVCARLHDVGKMAIPESILRKPGLLTPEERSVMETHADKGADLLSITPGIHPDIVSTARYHHERYDGLGYHSLQGEDIPFISRIVAIADVYDALVSPRSYKAGMTPGDALELMTADNDGHRMGRRAFDPYLLRAFVSYTLENHDNLDGNFSSDQREALSIYALSHPMDDFVNGSDNVWIEPDGIRYIKTTDDDNFDLMDPLNSTVEIRDGANRLLSSPSNDLRAAL